MWYRKPRVRPPHDTQYSTVWAIKPRVASGRHQGPHDRRRKSWWCRCCPGARDLTAPTTTFITEERLCFRRRSAASARERHVSRDAGRSGHTSLHSAVSVPAESAPPIQRPNRCRSLPLGKYISYGSHLDSRCADLPILLKHSSFGALASSERSPYLEVRLIRMQFEALLSRLAR